MLEPRNVRTSEILNVEAPKAESNEFGCQGHHEIKREQLKFNNFFKFVDISWIQHFRHNSFWFKEWLLFGFHFDSL